MTFLVECCGVRRGLLPGGSLICPRCDHGPGDAGPWLEDRVTDVDESISSITNVVLSVGPSTRTIGWIADLEQLPDLLEQVAAELRKLTEERQRDLS